MIFCCIAEVPAKLKTAAVMDVSPVCVRVAVVVLAALAGLVGFASSSSCSSADAVS